MPKNTDLSCPRNPISDCLAFVAQPALEDLTEPLERVMSETAALNTVVFLGVRSAFGDSTKATSALLDTNLWSEMRASAQSVGRVLPTRPPTKNKWYCDRRKITDEALEAFSQAVSVAALHIARSTGLCDPDVPMDPRVPRKANTIVVDGSVFRLHNSKSTGYAGKPDPEETADLDEGVQSDHNRKVNYGEPFSLATIRGDNAQQRVILGAKPYTDGDEMKASMGLIKFLADAAQGGVHAVACDALMGDVYFPEIMDVGAVPVARMTSANHNAKLGVAVSDATAVNRPSTRIKRHAAKKSKRRLRAYRLESFTHSCTDGSCTHFLWAVDGALVALDTDRPPVEDDTRLAPIRCVWGPRTDRAHLIASYEIACQNSTVCVAFDLGEEHRRDRALVGTLRPVPEAAGAFRVLSNVREDVESCLATIKERLHFHGRADAEGIDRVWLNLLGQVLLLNTICWDVHVSHHTLAAQNHQDRLSERAEKQRRKQLSTAA